MFEAGDVICLQNMLWGDSSINQRAEEGKGVVGEMMESSGRGRGSLGR